MTINSQLSRREFLRHLTVLSTAAILAAGTASAQEAPPVEPVQWHPVGKLTAFKPGQVQKVILRDQRDLYVRRLPGKKPALIALSAACTHKGCTVDWTPEEKKFVCPCHGGKFDPNGLNVAGPPPKPLPKYPVRVVKGVVQVLA